MSQSPIIYDMIDEGVQLNSGMYAAAWMAKLAL
jgi:hypothetical protein